MTRPPPTSTLFPYTTLFRSHHDRLDEHAPHLLALGDFHRGDVAGVQLLHELAVFDFCFFAPAARRDRKSTRLNSSHLGISYAVFCLNKKITNSCSTSKCCRL